MELLVQKGLLIADPSAVMYWLSHNSYFRLNHYSFEFKDYKNANGNYIQNTTFEKIRDLYFFDRKLRMTVFEVRFHLQLESRKDLGLERPLIDYIYL